MTDDSKQTVETILGPIPINELGETLTHEHLLSVVCKENKRSPYFIENEDVFPEDLTSIDSNPYGYEANFCLNDDETARNMNFEVLLFKQNYGKTIVNTSTFNMKIDLYMLRSVSKFTGVNIIIGSEYSLNNCLCAKLGKIPTENIYDELKHGLEHGRKLFPGKNSPMIKSAFIGETPCYNNSQFSPIHLNLTEYEKVFIRASGMVQEELHCPVTLYPGICSEAPAEILRIYEEGGGDSSKAIMSHVDFAFPEKQTFLEFVDNTKCYLEFSMFGYPCSLYQNIDILSDAQRIKRIKQLKKDGKLNRVLMSHDIHTKNRMVSLGGLGLGHISKNIKPLMLKRGFTMRDLKMLMVENPKNWLSYDKTS